MRFAFLKRGIPTIPFRIWGFLLLLSLPTWLLVSCEKDDICVDGNTPLLVVRFYDAANPTEFKDVQALRVVGLGQEFTVDTFQDRTGQDSIGLPLRIDQENTTFLLIQESSTEEEFETGNIDTLTFNYETKEVFISRACGFVANYEALTNELKPGSDNWILDVEITRSLVQMQDSAHVKIYH